MQVDPKSAKYWLQAEEEAEKLQTEMSDEQKKMLADFEKHFPRSKLVEESKKAQDGNMIWIKKKRKNNEMQNIEEMIG